MSDFDAGDLPPELSDVADRLRSCRYEAGALELDAIKTDILKRGSGRRVARGRRMRKRTFVTALIMFAAIGTGSAGAIGFGGKFFSITSLFNLAPAKTATATIKPTVTPPKGSPAFTPAKVTSAATTPAAFCTQYTCATSTNVACSPVVVIIFGFTIFPATCIVTVTNTSAAFPPDGTVTVTAQGGGTQTCTLTPISASASRCTVNFPSFTPNLLNAGNAKIGLFSLVTANYLGDPGAGLQPSSDTTTIIASIVTV
jgi:hypothetical protein